MIICAKTIITGDGETVLKDAAVMVDGSGKIQKVGSKDEVVQAYPQEEVTDYGEATIFPGMFDMHTATSDIGTASRTALTIMTLSLIHI